MGWRDILKINIPEDWVEKYLITQEEYDNLSLEEKARYHSRVFQKYRRENQSSSREAKYHSNNRRRLLNNPKTAVNKPHPTEEEDFKHKHGERIVPQRGRKYKKRKKRQNNKINQIIIDYFTIYNRRFGRNPTLQDIANEEGRPLTVDEIESFKRYAQGR